MLDGALVEEAAMGDYRVQNLRASQGIRVLLAQSEKQWRRRKKGHWVPGISRSSSAAESGERWRSASTDRRSETSPAVNSIQHKIGNRPGTRTRSSSVIIHQQQQQQQGGRSKYLVCECQVRIKKGFYRPDVLPVPIEQVGLPLNKDEFVIIMLLLLTMF